VVARGHPVDAPVEQLIADLARDPEAGSGVLRVGDHEVEAPIGKSGQVLGTAQDVDPGQVRIPQLNVLPAQVFDRHPVHVGDPGRGRDLQGQVESPDLDPLSAEVGREAPALLAQAGHQT